MKFQIELTERADRDLRNIFLYIALDLGSSKNAAETSESFVDSNSFP